MLMDMAGTSGEFKLETDICIIGGGIAGITLARDLHGRGHDIILLESGGREYEKKTQSLFAGSNSGMTYYPLEHSRLRLLGGSTTVWGGRCALMEELDFDRREWVAGSGWPISRADLMPWYEQAHRQLGLGPVVYDERLWAELGLTPPAFAAAGLTTRFWRFDEARGRFNFNGISDLVRAPDVRIMLHANVVHIQARENARAIEEVRVRALDGGRARVRARHFVLAAGGIENPRLLLASRDVEPQGIGNIHDQVGRCFMEHPHGRAGIIQGPGIYRFWSLLRKRYPRHGDPLAPIIVPTPELQRREGILNTGLTLKMHQVPLKGLPLDKQLYFRLKNNVLHATKGGLRIWGAWRDARSWLGRYFIPAVNRFRAIRGGVGLSAIIRAEQAPNPESRVILSEQRDALGLPQAQLNWQLTELDKHTVVVLAEVLGAEVERLGIGRLESSVWLADDSLEWPVDRSVSNHYIGGYHHMGTTRMSADPKRGVVNSDCRVHGYENLYVAGSSVFPTGGWANPNLTILALTHRLAAHLVARLDSGSSGGSLRR
jgi:choline dehydrogenase-like flavoprotein